jgi:hypothetical protein
MYFCHTYLYLRQILLRTITRVSSDDIVTSSHAGHPNIYGFIHDREDIFSLLQTVQTGYGVCLAPYSVGNEGSFARSER